MNHLKAAADVVLTVSRFPKGHSAGLGDTKVITCHPSMLWCAGKNPYHPVLRSRLPRPALTMNC